MSDYTVTVCSECLRASCWTGEFMCEHARSAGTVERRASDLRELNREHPSYYSRERCARRGTEVNDNGR